MKALFTCILIALAIIAIGYQCGGLDAAINNIQTGRAAATLRGY